MATPSLQSVITNDGMSKTIVAQASKGFFINIKSFGVSETAGALDVTRTTANTEWYNALISSGVQIDNNTIEILCEIPSGVGSVTKNVNEIYLYANDVGDVNTYLFVIAQPTINKIYHPGGSLQLKIQFQIQNLNVSSVYTFQNTQALEVTAHNTDPNAHQDIQLAMNKHGVYRLKSNRIFQGQNVDAFADVNAVVSGGLSDGDIVYQNPADTLKYTKAVADGTAAQDGVGVYVLATETVIHSGIHAYTHALSVYTPLYLSSSTPGAISTTKSDILIGFALPDNKMMVSVRNLRSYGSILGGGNAQGTIKTILGGIAPLESFIDGIDFYGFTDNSQDIFINYKLSDGFVPGSPLVIRSLPYYGQGVTSGKFLLKAECTLLQKNVHVLGTYSNIHTSTNTEVTVPNVDSTQGSTGNLDLTDSQGKINLIQVSPGDILRIRIFRDRTNETTPANADILIPKDSFEIVKL